MMNAFSALLEARNPALGCFRSYRLEAGTDLLGDWLVEVTFGRIGAHGRRLRYIVSGEEAARHLVRKVLRRRATARKRIGASYRFRELVDPGEWVPLTVHSRGLKKTLTGFRRNHCPIDFGAGDFSRR